MQQKKQALIFTPLTELQETIRDPRTQPNWIQSVPKQHDPTLIPTVQLGRPWSQGQVCATSEIQKGPHRFYVM